MSETEGRKALVKYGELLYTRKLAFGTGGNISLRVGKDRILITPSGACKGFLRGKDLIPMSISRGAVIGDGRPSIEAPFHLAFYRNREEVGAVMHTHPVSCTALAVAGVAVRPGLTPEGLLVLGEVPLVAYATPGTKELADRLEDSMKGGADAFVLERHGAITVGKDLEEAFQRMETLEFVAAVQLKAMSVGRARDLGQKEKNTILRLRQKQ